MGIQVGITSGEIAHVGGPTYIKQERFVIGGLEVVARGSNLWYIVSVVGYHERISR